MTTLTIHPASAASRVVRPRAPTVYVDGRRRRDLHVESFSLLPAPDFGRATLGLTMGDRHRPARGLENVSALPQPGSRVWLCLGPGRQHIVFDGIVARHLVGVGPDREQLSLETEDALKVILGTRLCGRWEVSDGQPVFVAAAKCVFNDGQHGLATTSSYSIGGRACRIFAAADDGQAWSVADILGYLLAAHVPADVEASVPMEVASLAAAIHPPRLSLTGLTVCEALARVCSVAGLAIHGPCILEAGRCRRGMAFYHPGRTGRRRSVRLQRRGADLDGRQTNLWKGRISIGRRAARRAILILGAPKTYESTFELQPCWDPTLATYDYRDFVRGEAADWLAVADVYRKWALNEAGQYTGEPHELDAFDFATINGDDFLVSRPRRFGPCLSRGRGGETLGVVVEVSHDSGSSWLRHGGAVRTSREECAIYLADDALGADYFQAALAGTVRMRVTASVEADQRLSVMVAGDGGVEVVEFPAGRWAKVHEGSVFYQDEDLPEPDERDDTDRLTQLARTVALGDAGTLEAELTLAQLDATCTVSDIIERVDGRGLELASLPDSAPHVRKVEHRCGEEWATHLIVSA